MSDKSLQIIKKVAGIVSIVAGVLCVISSLALVYVYFDDIASFFNTQKIKLKKRFNECNGKCCTKKEEAQIED